MVSRAGKKKKTKERQEKKSAVIVQSSSLSKKKKRTRPTLNAQVFVNSDQNANGKLLTLPVFFLPFFFSFSVVQYHCYANLFHS